MVFLKLSIQPFPYASRLATLAKLLPPKQWDTLRRAVYRRARYRCQICGREGRMYCHEIWQFNEERRRQFLWGFNALCELCHGVKHLTFVHDDYLQAKLIEHFMTVNNLTREQAEECLSVAYCEQRRLNQKQWIISYGKYNWQVPSVATVEQRRSYALFNHPRRR